MVTKSTLKRLNDFFRNVKLLQKVTESGVWDVCTSKTQNVVSRVFLAFLFLTIEMHIFLNTSTYTSIYIRTDTITDKENAIMKRKESKSEEKESQVFHSSFGQVFLWLFPVFDPRLLS